jgi:hypothetical protein
MSDTCTAVHVPPRAVGMPRAISAVAIFLSDAPVACNRPYWHGMSSRHSHHHGWEFWD